MDPEHTTSPVSEQASPPHIADEHTNDNDKNINQRQSAEFDPFSNAKVCSPFYRYNHDSPRTSCDTKPRTPNKHQSKSNSINDPKINVSIRDLEAAESDIGLTPSVTQEKSCNNGGNKDKSIFRLWNRRRGSRGGSMCMIKPKKNLWWVGLHPWQRLLIKIVVAVLLVGTMIGIAVGVSVKVHGGVYKNSNQTVQIGN